MRITNKIIQNNSLTNINNNKILQDKLSTQIATEKKISRPSDDPIVALRSLRLRTNVSQTEQFREKNAEDAESWLKVTEDAIKTLSDIITDIRKQYVKGASDTLTVKDRGIILEDLEALSKEIYNTGNADFAGRSIFTGYRTGETLTFQKEETVQFSIYEDFKPEDMDEVTYIHQDDTDETNVYNANISRIRLSYNNLMDTAPEITVPLGTLTGVSGTNKDTDGDGTDDVFTITPSVVSNTATPDPYQTVCDDKDAIVFVPETGELLIGENVAKQLEGKEDTITVNYQKNEWAKGDLRPEHYFKCEDMDQSIEYNFESTPDAEIYYNIGVNQSLRINTNASECFNHSITRDIDDIISAIHEVEGIEAVITDLTASLDALTETDPARVGIQKQLDAAKKSQAYINEKLSNMFSAGITKAEGYLTDTNLALTNCGTRSKRLELIQNRLDTQLSTLKELKSENEDVDMAETAVKLSSAQYAYDAALMSTGKTLKESLLNYL